MKQLNPKLLPLVSQIGIVLSTFLVSVGNAYAQSLLDNREPTKTVIVAQAQQLEQLQQERRINAQVQAEANQIFSRTMTLFNVLLVTLALLLAAAIAATSTQDPVRAASSACACSSCARSMCCRKYAMCARRSTDDGCGHAGSGSVPSARPRAGRRRTG